MFEVLVGHVKNPTFGFGPDPKYPQDYTLVASVLIPQGTRDCEEILDFAFEKTNSIHCHWAENPEVTALAKKNLRSTSVGDVMVLPGGKIFRCASVGWTAVDTSNGVCSPSGAE